MKHNIVELLNMLYQEHIARHLQTLSEEDQQMLAEQIESLDLSMLKTNNATEHRGKFEPLFAKTLDEICQNRDRYTEIGLQVIQNGKVGAVLLAGGQGNRLVFDHPKVMFNIGVERELYIFECLISNLSILPSKQMHGFL